ncbi:hypothetical protein SLEP1_g30568 [Rubroshorea leprosula]|uniref:Uncharacterized protein n=1 Tax=Rubroshorea leprosula TaxID=152421 RepID=A0AAV5K8U0_9ROSI|nr:hypothetical protein SLEP1_g30568 [Rubroshorea leprosula]
MAKNAPPLNDMMASIKRYPIAELAPKSIAKCDFSELEAEGSGEKRGGGGDGVGGDEGFEADSTIFHVFPPVDLDATLKPRWSHVGATLKPLGCQMPRKPLH